jgi:MYXO-CTERM domain-containing protein
MRFAFTQTPVTTGVISASATLAVIPEPSSIVEGLTGLAGVVIYRLRRRRRQLAAA